MQNIVKKSSDLLTLGWREWVSLPELGIPAIKAKVDTGAQTSALHAVYLQIFYKEQQKYVRFQVHPLQKENKVTRYCEALIVDERKIKSSNGRSEQRYTIITPICIANRQWDIELTLTNRSVMSHRMLLGRQAMHNILVMPRASFMQGRLSSQDIIDSYQLRN